MCTVCIDCKLLLLQEPGVRLTGWEAHRVGQLLHKQGTVPVYKQGCESSIRILLIRNFFLDPELCVSNPDPEKNDDKTDTGTYIIKKKFV